MFVHITHPKAGRSLVSERAFTHLAKRGWERDAAAPVPEDSEPKRPQKNDSTDAWRTYAIARGMEPEQAASMGRDELVAHFETQEN